MLREGCKANGTLVKGNWDLIAPLLLPHLVLPTAYQSLPLILTYISFTLSVLIQCIDPKHRPSHCLHKCCLSCWVLPAICLWSKNISIAAGYEKTIDNRCRSWLFGPALALPFNVILTVEWVDAQRIKFNAEKCKAMLKGSFIEKY